MFEQVVVGVLRLNLCLVVSVLVIDCFENLLPSLVVLPPKIPKRVSVSQGRNPNTHRVRERAPSELGNNGIVGTKGEGVRAVPKEMDVVLYGGTTAASRRTALAKSVQAIVVDG